MPDAAPLEPGDPRSLGQYEMVGRLGAGGQGAVFLGKSRDGRYVAVKLLHAQMANDPAARARFTREVAAAQKVEPFCTARVLEADVQGDQPYVVSEFIDGPSLHDVVAHNGPRSAAELERLAIGTATALAAIHEAGIVHRDFKPNNVMLASDGPRVVDFGIARTVNSQESQVTATGMVVGTPGYLAPEQLTGAPLTPAVDIFAWGATMVFAATGQSPFEADTLPVIINRILNEDPDLSALPPGPVRDLVGRCLSKDAGLRPPAPQLLLNLLGHVGAAPSNPAAGQEDLLNQGTRIAAQLPAPPPVPPARRAPAHQPITPPPMPMNPAAMQQGGMPQGGMQQGGMQQGGMQQGPMGGPHTPPPQPITPPPMPMYQGGMQGGMQHGPTTPPPMQMQQGPPGPHPPMYGPQGGRQSSSTGPIIAIGCGVLALISIIVIVVVIIVAGDSGEDDPPVPRFTLPTTYTPSTPSPTGFARIPTEFYGVWTGTGVQTNGSWQVRYNLLTVLGSVTYTEGSDCFGTLRPEPGGTASQVTLKITISRGTCISGYVTFTRLTSASLRFEEKKNLTDTTPLATGTVRK
ncbi:serine/threonine-protein kinase [Actinomadura xylanilytica]|uniref:serine/threonine-protein kinase n=1 Tax=Actinomadura xylanilytica TaxID=887459 RepID=UPI00255ABB44|nr:serine/threonine-protein kinase [Actinomadura xylanilytica]MDL4775014.1 serine/threonine-protein kinase [Actinomadura xylanilytica]